MRICFNMINPFHRAPAPQTAQPNSSEITRIGTSAIQGQKIDLVALAASINHHEKTPLAKVGLTQAELEAIAPHLRYVDCTGLKLDDLQRFISLCTNATYLCIQSSKIKKLDNLPPNLETLNCSGCLSLTSISLKSAPQLTTLVCDRCPKLTTLSLLSIPKLQKLVFDYCTALPALALPDAPLLRDISCDYCSKLASISLASAPQLNKFWCVRCTALTALTLPAAPELTELSCCWCTALALLSFASAPKLTKLYCDYSSLRTLPLSLGQCPELYNISIDGTGIDPTACHNILNQCRRMRNGQTEDILPYRLKKWNGVALDISALTVEQKETLNEWLARLERTQDFAASQSSLADTVCKIIADVLKNKEFQELFFSQAEANNTCCQDRAAMSLNEIYTSWKILCTPLNLKVLTGVAKTLRLRKELQKLIKEDERESVEIFLYYESTLRERLNLVTAIQNMGYSTIGNRSWIDKEKLIKEVEANYYEELCDLPIMEKLLEKPWKEISSEFINKLDQLGDCPKGGPNDLQVLNFQHRQGEIMQEWRKKKIAAAKRWHDKEIKQTYG